MSNQRGKVLNDAEKLYRMLQPGPKFLIERQRQLIRHGELMYFSVNTMSKKPRYFWLFNDCLLVTKRMGAQKFQLQVVIHFSSGMKVVTMPDSPNYEFRLLCPEKGTLAKAKQRRVVMWGKSKEHKEQWLNDLKHHLWKSIGMVGPDPTTPQGSVAYSTKNDEEEVRHMMKDVSLRDRRPSDPQQQRAQHGGRGAAGAGSGAPGSSRQPQQQQAADYGDEEFEQWADDGEAEGDEQWSDTHGGQNASDALISFDDDFSQADAYSHQPYTHSGAHPPGVGLAPIGGAYPAQGGVGQLGGYQAPSAQPYGYGGQYELQYPTYNAGAGGPAYGGGYAQPAPIGNSSYHAGAGGQSYGVQYGAQAGADSAAYYGQMYNNPQASQAPAGAGVPADAGHYSHLYGQMGDAGMPLPTSSAPVGTAAGDIAPAETRAADDFARNELLAATKALEDLAVDLAIARSAADVQSVGPAFVDVTDSAQFIARACTVLLSAASRAQQERGYAGSDSAYHADPKWAEGLVSAARYVVASIGHLVSTSKQYVVSEGGMGNEPLAASAFGVNVSTAQLLAAFRARYTKGNDLGLEEAVKSITAATQKLVEDAKTAQQSAPSTAHGATAAAGSAYADPTSSKYNLTQRQVNEIEAQARILKLEKEAQAARLELARLRKAEYGSGH